MTEKFDIMQVVTDKIIEALEKGTVPWAKPWIGSDLCIKHRSGEAYSLINQLLLGKPGEYLSYKEAQDAGGHVKKGAKGRFVVFWKMLQTADKNALDADGKPVVKVIPLLRYYTVFHIDDCEGVKPKWNRDLGTQEIDKGEKVLLDYVARAGVTLERVQSGRAFYRPSEHLIRLPKIEQFADANEYYSTAFHEAVHSTGHHTLLDRFPQDAMMAAFGSESYSKEELIAEIGACAIMGRLGLDTDGTFRNSAAYIKGWLSALKNDKRLIVSAAGKAEKAVKLILNEQDAAEIAA